MKQAYRETRLGAERLRRIEQANEIIDALVDAGYTPTLRQVYYRHVALGLIANRDTEYENLGELLNVGRLCGLVDWESIEDRTRFVREQPSWPDPASIVQDLASQFRVNQWEGQEYHVEVWIEKDALIGIAERPCAELDVPYFSCRGYVSQSEMYVASQRLYDASVAGRRPIVLHLGDHDPSGVQMSEDIEDRLTMFLEVEGVDFEVRRIALTMEQIREFDPPPNPAKLSDGRARKYIARYGESSWELDAMPPAAMDQLIRDEIEQYIDRDAWREQEEKTTEGRRTLRLVSRRWDDVQTLVTA